MSVYERSVNERCRREATMEGMMAGMGLAWALGLVVLVLAALALMKYLKSKS